MLLSSGTTQQLDNIEVSPFGLHWPDLDEDLSFRGLLESGYGQPRAATVESHWVEPEFGPVVVVELLPLPSQVHAAE